MGRVTAYEASDGTLLRDRKAYLRHEVNLTATERIEAKLTAVLHERGVVGDQATAKVSEFKDLLIRAVGLDYVRELLNTPFKPTDGSDAVAEEDDVAEPVKATESVTAEPSVAEAVDGDRIHLAGPTHLVQDDDI